MLFYLLLTDWHFLIWVLTTSVPHLGVGMKMSCEDLAKIKINKTQSWPLSSRLHRQWSCVVSFFFFFLNWDFSWLKKHLRHREKYGQFSKCLFFWMGQYCGDIFGLETYVHVNVCWMQGYFFAWIVRTICCKANWQITSPPWMWNKQLSLPLPPPPPVPGNPCSFQERHPHLKG